MTPLEKHEARVLNAWLDAHKICWAHVPNERPRGRHHPPGVKRGLPDYLIFDRPSSTPGFGKLDAADREDAVLYVGAAIELKRTERARTTVEQELWLSALRKRGWAVFVAFGADAAIAWLRRMGYGR